MKTYAEKYHSREHLMNNDIQYIGAEVWTPYSNIKSELQNDFHVSDEEDYVPIYYNDLDYYCEDTLNYDWCMGSDLDELMLRDFIDSVIGHYDYYLICAYNSNWMGQTGYKIEDNKYKIFQRSYDVSQYIVGASARGKSLLIREFSHDVPMGHETLIIGLTEKEHNKITNAEWEKVIDFADENSKTIIRF